MQKFEIQWTGELDLRAMFSLLWSFFKRFLNASFSTFCSLQQLPQLRWSRKHKLVESLELSLTVYLII